jgi:hypothetical protein
LIEPCKECVEWLGRQGRGPEADSLLKLSQQCGKGTPTFPRLLARALPWLREKLPFDAPQVGPPGHGRARVELPECSARLAEHSLGWAGSRHSMTTRLPR